MSSKKNPFWKEKPLEELTPEEWESLCDRCGLCCTRKFEDEDTDEILHSLILCRYFDDETCLCTSYKDRNINVPTCVHLTPEKARTFNFLAPTCAYRLLAVGKDLEWWHPLVSNSPDTVHEAGISIRHKGIPEQHVHPDEIDNFIIAPDLEQE